jgi:hypothetical protein
MEGSRDGQPNGKILGCARTPVPDRLTRYRPIAQGGEYLLAWHNAEENGGWDPIDLWNVDDTVADDMLSALALIRQRHTYAEELGFRSQMQAVWE